MPRRTHARHGRKGSKAETPTNETRRYGTTARIAQGRCPVEDCLAVFSADDQDQVDMAIQDHMDAAHGEDYDAEDKA